MASKASVRAMRSQVRTMSGMGLAQPHPGLLLSVRPRSSATIPSRTLFTARKPKSAFRPYFSLALLGFAATFGVAYHLDSRSAIHRWVAIPLLQTFTDPETAQKLAVKLLSLGVMPRDVVKDDDFLEAEVAGLKLSNPVGLAAGFDKQAEAIDGLLNLGFGIVEIGSVTPEPQPGNPQPRYFRLILDRGAINRYGFNSDGHEAVLSRLRDRIQRWALGRSSLAQSRIPLPDSSSPEAELLARTGAGIADVLEGDRVPRSLKPGQLLFVNLGKNKASEEESVEDYVKGVKTFGPYADALVVNVSSPNTPGLRGLQRRGILQGLMSEVVSARNGLATHKLGSDGKASSSTVPVLVKVAPDLDNSELHDVADAALASGIDGLIISNTTVQRPKSLLSSPDLISEKGGLSGAPLKPLALDALRIVRERVGSKMSLIGCGGIYSGADALDFAKAGASAVELYTSFGYEGVGHPRRIKDELTGLLKKEGKTWKQVVGSGLPAGEEKPKVPTSEKETIRSGGASERMGEAVADVKGEIENLRRSFGLGMVSHQRAKPKTAAQLFKPDPDDTEYVGLLHKVHTALGIQPASPSDLPDLIDSDLTRTEALRARIGTALQDPSMAPSAAIQGIGAEATVGGRSSPTSGKADNAPSKLVEVAPRSGGSEIPSASATRQMGRLAMGGRPDFNATDGQRVV